MRLSRYRLAHTYRLPGDYAKALETLQQILNLEARQISAYDDMGVAYQPRRNPQRARECFLRDRGGLQALGSKALRQPDPQWSLAMVLVGLGDTEQAKKLLSKAMAQAPQLHLDAAYVLSLLHQNKQAVEQLELGIQGGFMNYIWRKMNPDLEPLHGDAPYEKLLRQWINV